MARFDVFPNPDSKGFLLDVQADLLDGLNTRVVVPLIPIQSAPMPAKRLNPVFEIEAEPHVMVTQFMADPAGLVLCALQAEHLCRSRLATGGICSAGKGAGACAFFIDTDHRSLDDVEILLFPP